MGYKTPNPSFTLHSFECHSNSSLKYMFVWWFCSVQAYCTSILFHYLTTTCTDCKLTDACLIISKLFTVQIMSTLLAFKISLHYLSLLFLCKFCNFIVYYRNLSLIWCHSFLIFFFFSLTIVANYTADPNLHEFCRLLLASPVL